MLQLITEPKEGIDFEPLTEDEALRLQDLRETSLILYETEYYKRLGYFHIKQNEFFKSDKATRLFFGGNVTGKSKGSMRGVAMYARDEYFFYNSEGEVVRRRIPHNQAIWVFSPSFSTHKNSTQMHLMQYFTDAEITDVKWYDKAMGVLSGFTVKSTQTRIEFKTYDQDREVLQGARLDLVVFDEEPPEKIYKEMLVRVKAGRRLNIWFSMTPLKGKCFDEETELLTDRGWCRYDEIKKSDKLLSYDIDNKETRWSPILGFYASHYNGKMMHLSKEGFDFLVTSDHKWVVESKEKKGCQYKIESENLRGSHGIVAMSGRLDQDASDYSDAFIKVVGYAVNDGCFCENGIVIKLFQSWTANREKCNAMLSVMDELDKDKKDWNYKLIPFKNKNTKDSIAMHISISGDLARHIRTVTTGKNHIDYNWISSLDNHQLEVLFNTFIMTDSHRKKDGYHWTQSLDRGDLISIFQYICTLTGRRSHVTYYETNNKTYARIDVSKKQFSKCLIDARTLVKEDVDYDGMIWCPQTRDGTVVARRNGCVSISSNTWIYYTLYKADDKSDLWIGSMSWRDNPFLTSQQLARLRKGYSKDELVSREHGLFADSSKTVCGWFEREKHIIEPKDIPLRGCSYYLSVDFGWSPDPSVVLFIATDVKQNIYVYDAIKAEQVQAGDLARICRERLGTRTLSGVYADSANPDKIAEFRRAGFMVYPVDKNIYKRFDKKLKFASGTWDQCMANSMAYFGEVREGTGEPKLYISKGIEEYDTEVAKEINWLAEQIESLNWKRKDTRLGSEDMESWDDHRRLGHHFDGVYALAYFCVMFRLAGDRRLETPVVHTVRKRRGYYIR